MVNKRRWATDLGVPLFSTVSVNLNFQASEMTEIGLGASMNDMLINDLNMNLNVEISRFKNWMKDMKRLMLGQEMRYEDLRLFMFDKQYLEIEIEKKKMQLKIEKIKIEIVKLHGLRMTKVNEVSESIPSVQRKKKMKLIGSNNNDHHHQKLLSESIPLVVEKMKEIGFSNDFHHRRTDLKLMNTELKSNIKKLKLLEHEIYNMECWIEDMKMTKMKIKDITKPDGELKHQVLQFNDEESSDNELETHKYNKEKMKSCWVKSISIQNLRNIQRAEEKKQMKANGLDYAAVAGIRAIKQYWHLPLRVEEAWKKLELPKKGGLCGWDEFEKWPLTVQIYSLKLTSCCSEDQDYAVDASGVIYLLIGKGIPEPKPKPYSFRVQPQTLTKKDPYLLLHAPTCIPLLFPSCPPPMIYVNLRLRRRDEPDKLTSSMEVVDEVYMSGKEFTEGTSALSEDVNLGTGKQYMLKLTHGIVVNTIVANISVHLHRSLWDSWDGKCKITASDKHNPCKPAVLANYKKVPVTINYDNSCLHLVRRRICVDFFGVLVLYMKCFGTNACLDFIPRDCYSHDNCEHKEALEGITVQVKWSTS